MVKNTRKPIIAVDFDNTLFETDFKNVLSVNNDLISFLKSIRNEIILILWTCRTGNLLNQAIETCKNKGLYFDCINCNHKSVPFKTSNKIYADIYIDDKGFTNKNCKTEICELLKNTPKFIKI